MSDIDALIARYALEPHPEGGFYREMHRSDFVLPRAALGDTYSGDRCAVTSIIFLLPTGVVSAWHRVVSEEIFLYQGGDPLRLEVAQGVDAAGRPEGDCSSSLLGPDEGQALQLVVERSVWQRAEPMPGPHGYALIACVVAPGFEFDDFEMIDSD